jgi:hypothetical protein
MPTNAPFRRYLPILTLGGALIAAGGAALWFGGAGGAYQRGGLALAVCGLALAATAFQFGRSERARGLLSDLWAAWPAPAAVSYRLTPRDFLIAAGLAAAAVAVDLAFSARLGLLAYPPFHDGVSYVLDAKKLYWRVQAWLHGTPAPAADHFGIPALLWWALLLLSYLVFGEGEWQAYTARFWPLFLALLLVRWLVRRRGNERLAWAATLATVLLPTLSVGLRSAGWEYFTGTATFMLEWYLADLRPDLLFTVLLLWATVPLIEQAKELTPRALLASGAFAGLAVLAKPSAAPMLLYAWGLTLGFVGLVNVRGLWGRRLAALACWSLLPFAALVAPAALAGVAKWIYTYLGTHLGKNIYANPDRTLWTECAFYWQVFPYHLGQVEGWLALAAAGGLALWALRHVRNGGDYRPAAVLGLAAALYALLTATPNKNYFVGLPFFLAVWLAAWLGLAWLAGRWRALPNLLLGGAAVHAAAVAAAGCWALAHWPAGDLAAGPANKAAVRQMARDLSELLTPEDHFAYVVLYGFPTTLEYYMPGPGRPQESNIDVYHTPTVEAYLKETLGRCKAVLVYEEDVADLGRFVMGHEIGWPYFQATAEFVKRPGSPFRLARSYHFADRTPPLLDRADKRLAPITPASYRLRDGERHGFTVQLYLREEPTVAGP